MDFQTVVWIFLWSFFCLVISLGLSRYLKQKREKDSSLGITIRPLKAEGRAGFAYHSEDLEEMLRFLEEYQAEVERIAVGYHQRMTLEGPEAAQQWLEQQTGKRPSPPDRERR